MRLRVELDRRRWLRAAGLVVLGGTSVTVASAAPPPVDSAEEVDGEAGKHFLAGPACPQVLKVSKRLAGPLKLFPEAPCPCACKVGDKAQTIYRARYRAVLALDTVKPCDETEQEPLLQRGVELWLDGELTLRQDKCPGNEQPVFVGRNQGVYRLHRYRPNQDIMTGPFCGTEGVLPTEREGKRCCAPGQGLGSFCGDGIGKLAGWSLCVSYHSLIKALSPERLCIQTTLDLVMDLDGVLIGPCKPIQ